ncbi:MAG: hypothetical protein WBD30_00425 [Bacteroidota bacterium]
MPAARRGVCGYKRNHSDLARAQSTPGVEPEPAEPEHTATQQSQGYIVGGHHPVRKAGPPPQHDRCDECRYPGVDMDDGPPREVQSSKFTEPSAHSQLPTMDPIRPFPGPNENEYPKRTH